MENKMGGGNCRTRPLKQDVVLAYSGGLDTSVILRWLLDKGYNVHTYMANLGQEDDFKAAEKKALKIGASTVYTEDLRREFVKDYIFPAIRANAKYEGRYLLGTSLARPLTAKGQIEYAKKIGAKILSHGATGKGNDQVRFELAYRTLYPEAEIYAPHKDPEFLDKLKGGSRDVLIEYAKEKGIPITQTKQKPWSSDDNMLHISYEAGMLENPMTRPLEEMFKMTVSPQNAPDKEIMIEIGFLFGNPYSLAEIKNNKLKMSRIKLFCFDDTFDYLNKIAGQNGIGRLDMVESRYVGMKSRGVYETPAGTVLHIAHQDLEAITLDKEIIKRNQHISIDLAERIYSGYWFSPEREAMQREIDATQMDVKGIVRLALYKGNVTVIGRRSDESLYDEGIASMHEKGNYDPKKARGFIDINALRLQVSAKRNKK
jgi:argininosuccinate synthase